MTLAFTITALEGTKMRTEDCHAGESERTSLVPRPGSSQPRMSRPSAGGQRRAPSRTPRVSHVAAMHRLVQGQHEEALPVSGELPLQPLWWRFRRLVEVRFAQRLQQLQVLLAQLTILLPNLGERWIRAGIGDGFRALAKVLLPLRRGILVSEKYRRDRALNQREMTQNPERVTSAVRCRKRRCRAAHLVNYTEHGSVRNSQCEFNSLFRLHFLSSWNCLPLSITAPGRARIRGPATFLGAVGHDYRGRCRENPRTMQVVHDAQDVLIDHFESSNRIRRPFVPVLALHHDCQLAVHFCNCQSPRHSLLFVLPEVRRFVDPTGKAICDAESSIRANEFAKPLPITLIEPVDVEMQKP